MRLPLTAPVSIFFAALGMVAAHLLWQGSITADVGLPKWAAEAIAALCGAISAHLVGKRFVVTGRTWRGALMAGILISFVGVILFSYFTAWTLYVYASGSPTPAPEVLVSPLLRGVVGTIRVLFRPFEDADIFLFLLVGISGSVILIRRPPLKRSAWYCLATFTPLFYIVFARTVELEHALARDGIYDRAAMNYAFAIDAVDVAIACASCWLISLATAVPRASEEFSPIQGPIDQR